MATSQASQSAGDPRSCCCTCSSSCEQQGQGSCAQEQEVEYELVNIGAAGCKGAWGGCSEACGGACQSLFPAPRFGGGGVCGSGLARDTGGSGIFTGGWRTCTSPAVHVHRFCANAPGRKCCGPFSALATPCYRKCGLAFEDECCANSELAYSVTGAGYDYVPSCERTQTDTQCCGPCIRGRQRLCDLRPRRDCGRCCCCRGKGRGGCCHRRHGCCSCCKESSEESLASENEGAKCCCWGSGILNLVGDSGVLEALPNFLESTPVLDRCECYRGRNWTRSCQCCCGPETNSSCLSRLCRSLCCRGEDCERGCFVKRCGFPYRLLQPICSTVRAGTLTQSRLCGEERSLECVTKPMTCGCGFENVCCGHRTVPCGCRRVCVGTRPVCVGTRCCCREAHPMESYRCFGSDLLPLAGGARARREDEAEDEQVEKEKKTAEQAESAARKRRFLDIFDPCCIRNHICEHAGSLCCEIDRYKRCCCGRDCGCGCGCGRNCCDVCERVPCFRQCPCYRCVQQYRRVPCYRQQPAVNAAVVRCVEETVRPFECRRWKFTPSASGCGGYRGHGSACNLSPPSRGCGNWNAPCHGIGLGCGAGGAACGCGGSADNCCCCSSCCCCCGGRQRRCGCSSCDRCCDCGCCSPCERRPISCGRYNDCGRRYVGEVGAGCLPYGRQTGRACTRRKVVGCQGAKVINTCSDCPCRRNIYIPGCGFSDVAPVGESILDIIGSSTCSIHPYPREEFDTRGVFSSAVGVVQATNAVLSSNGEQGVNLKYDLTVTYAKTPPPFFDQELRLTVNFGSHCASDADIGTEYCVKCSEGDGLFDSILNFTSNDPYKNATIKFRPCEGARAGTEQRVKGCIFLESNRFLGGGCFLSSVQAPYRITGGLLPVLGKVVVVSEKVRDLLAPWECPWIRIGCGKLG